MAIQAGAIDRVLEDCVHVLKTIHSEIQSDRTPYAVDLRRLLESGLVLRFGEYLQFLEKFGFLKLDRRTDILNLTRPGKELIQGKISRTDSLREDAAYHFGERLNEIDLDRSGISQVGSPLDERYLPRRLLGSGALSKVSEGVHLALNRSVAIKQFSGLIDLFRGELTPEIRRELRARIEANAHVESDFVLPILDVNVDHETPYLVSEYCSGGNLRSLMDRQALSPDVALKLFHQACLALKAAHDNGLIHGDLKPENLLLTARGNLKLTDLGFSQLAQSESLAKQRAYVGYSSLGYLAPEMFRQDRHYTIASDIYSMGIILYELLVGRLPGRRSPLPSKVVTDLPEGVDDLFDRMASDDQDERISSMDDVLSALTGVMGLEGSLATVTVFLVAPFELPEPPEPSALSVGDAPHEDELGDVEMEADQALDENTGLETMNSSIPLVVDSPGLDAAQLQSAEAPDEQASALSSDSQPQHATADEMPSDAPETADQPLQHPEALQATDLRSQTAVHGNDSTSMIDSIVDEPS